MSYLRDLNICIITSWFPNKRRPNLGSFVYHFAKNLADAGVKVSVISPFQAGEDMIIEEGAIKIYRVKGSFPVLSILKLIDQIKPDIMHVHAPNIFSTTAVIVSKLRH